MSATTGILPVIDSCDGCGACCMVVTRPPFYHVFEDMGEEAWDRLERERPDLVAELRADYQARQASGGPFLVPRASGLTPRHSVAAITTTAHSHARCSRSATRIAATPGVARASLERSPERHRHESTHKTRYVHPDLPLVRNIRSASAGARSGRTVSQRRNAGHGRASSRPTRGASSPRSSCCTDRGGSIRGPRTFSVRSAGDSPPKDMLY